MEIFAGGIFRLDRQIELVTAMVPVHITEWIRNTPSDRKEENVLIV